MSSFVETKIFPRDDPFPLKFWLQVSYTLLKAASFDTFCLVAFQPQEIEKEVQLQSLSVCPSVRPSVTRRYCVKTTARGTMPFALSDSKICL